MLACKHVVYGMQIAITDEEIVKALVAELVQVMSGAPFAAALKVRCNSLRQCGVPNCPSSTGLLHPRRLVCSTNSPIFVVPQIAVTLQYVQIRLCAPIKAVFGER